MSTVFQTQSNLTSSRGHLFLPRKLLSTNQKAVQAIIRDCIGKNPRDSKNSSIFGGFRNVKDSLDSIADIKASVIQVATQGLREKLKSLKPTDQVPEVPRNRLNDLNYFNQQIALAKEIAILEHLDLNHPRLVVHISEKQSAELAKNRHNLNSNTLKSLSKRLDNISPQILLLANHRAGIDLLPKNRSDLRIIKHQIDDLMIRHAHLIESYNPTLELNLKDKFKELKRAINILLKSAETDPAQADIEEEKLEHINLSDPPKTEIKATGNALRDIDLVFSVLVINDRLVDDSQVNLSSRLEKATELAESAIKALDSAQEPRSFTRITQAKSSLRRSLEFLQTLPDTIKTEHTNAYHTLESKLQNLEESIRSIPIERTQLKVRFRGLLPAIETSKEVENIFQELGTRLAVRNPVNTNNELTALETNLDKLINYLVTKPSKTASKVKQASPEKTTYSRHHRIQIAPKPKDLRLRLNEHFERFKKGLANQESEFNIQRVELIESALGKLDSIIAGTYVVPKPVVSLAKLELVWDALEALLSTHEPSNQVEYFENLEKQLSNLKLWSQKTSTPRILHRKLIQLSSKFHRDPAVLKSAGPPTHSPSGKMIFPGKPSEFNQRRMSLLEATLQETAREANNRVQQNLTTQTKENRVFQEIESCLEANTISHSRVKALPRYLSILKKLATKSPGNAQTIHARLNSHLEQFNEELAELRAGQLKKKLIEENEKEPESHTERRTYLVEALKDIELIQTKLASGNKDTAIEIAERPISLKKPKPVSVANTQTKQASIPESRQIFNDIKKHLSNLNDFAKSQSIKKTKADFGQLVIQLSDLIDYAARETKSEDLEAISKELSKYSPSKSADEKAPLSEALTTTREAIFAIPNSLEAARDIQSRLKALKIRKDSQAPKAVMNESKAELNHIFNKLQGYLTQIGKDSSTNIKNAKEYTNKQLRRIKNQLTALKTFNINHLMGSQEAFTRLRKLFIDFSERITMLKADQITKFDREREKLLLASLTEPISNKARMYQDGPQIKVLNQKPIIAELKSPVKTSWAQGKKIEELLETLNQTLKPPRIDDDTVKKVQTILPNLLTKLKGSRQQWKKVFENLLSNATTITKTIATRRNRPPDLKEAQSLSYLKHALFRTVQVAKPTATTKTSAA